MEIRKTIIIDTQEDTAGALRRQFNDKRVDHFVTKPVLAGPSSVPCMAGYSGYARLSGRREKDGWTLMNEFFYHKGSDIPENPRVQQSSAVTGVSNTDAVKRVMGFKPPAPAEWW